MTNVNVTPVDASPLGSVSNAGWRTGVFNAQTKAAQNDTLTVSDAKKVLFAVVQVDATGASETNTVATNVITLTSATTGTVSGIVVYY